MSENPTVTMYRLQVAQHLAIRVDEAWAFFSDPRNLAILTPPDMRFALTSEAPAAIYPGLIRTYRLRPLLGLPATWVTEITHVDPGQRFIDEQRIGPYRLWHHEHRFRPLAGGTEVRDDIWYALPGGPLGGFVHRGLVRGRLRRIFAFRRRALAERFGELATDPGLTAPSSIPKAPPREVAWNTPFRR